MVKYLRNFWITLGLNLKIFLHIYKAHTTLRYKWKHVNFIIFNHKSLKILKINEMENNKVNPYLFMKMVYWMVNGVMEYGWMKEIVKEK